MKCCMRLVAVPSTRKRSVGCERQRRDIETSGKGWFPREDTVMKYRSEGFPIEEDIYTSPGEWLTPPRPRRDAAGHMIPREPEEFR